MVWNARLNALAGKEFMAELSLLRVWFGLEDQHRIPALPSATESREPPPSWRIFSAVLTEDHPAAEEFQSEWRRLSSVDQIFLQGTPPRAQINIADGSTASPTLASRAACSFQRWWNPASQSWRGGQGKSKTTPAWWIKCVHQERIQVQKNPSTETDNMLQAAACPAVSAWLFSFKWTAPDWWRTALVILWNVFVFFFLILSRRPSKPSL